MKYIAASIAATGFAVLSLYVGAVTYLETSFVYANSYTTVASDVTIVGEVEDGDIISYNPQTGLYHRTQLPEDETMYGVVVYDPVLYLQERDRVATGTPVVRYGEVMLNVSTANGVIRAGDLVTSSTLAGVGQRTSRDEGVYVIGFALDDMRLTGTNATTEDGRTVQLGKVPTALRVGPYLSRAGAAFIASSSVAGAAGTTRYDGDGGVDIFKVFRYLLAAAVAISAVVIASRRFGDTFSQSVISVGRNPLAEPRIRSMVLWNSLLILIISSVGFAISAAILLVP